jgi:hypothetical protein
MKDITLKRMKLYKDLIKSKSFFVIHMKTKCIKLINYFFFRRVFIMLTLNWICEHLKQTLQHVLFFCKKLINESSTHAAQRRNDEHEQTFKYREEFKNLEYLINENPFINSIFVD